MTKASNNKTALCQSAFGDFQLKRIPEDKNLYAWNSADLYLLQHLFELSQLQQIDLCKARILILNDSFGALSVALARFSCDSYNDSFLAHHALLKNLEHCSLKYKDKVKLLKSTDTLEGEYDLVLFKEVKNQAFLKDEMSKLSAHIHRDTIIIGSIMAKNLQRNTVELLNKTIGETKVSLTWKKARLLIITPDTSLLEKVKRHQSKDTRQLNQNNDYQSEISYYELENSKEKIYNYANVFSRNKLDIGTRFFLQHLPVEKTYKSIIDLGCGNGVLSLKIAQYHPEATICCIDESYMAIASASMTLQQNLPEKQAIHYYAGNALDGISPESADLILCNPPFHQQYIVGDAIAWQMFKQSKTTLIKGGELWVVGNRHLAYHLKLQKIFANCTLIASNKKFVILKAVKT